MSASARAHVTDLFGSPPLVLQAADFGWVRSRLYWSIHEQLVARQPKNRQWEYFPPETLIHDVGVLRFKGNKWPLAWAPSKGWE